VTIRGAGSAATILDSNGLDRLFDVLAETTISGVTLRNGNPGTGPTDITAARSSTATSSR
jgi:hypothetical protein